MIYIDSSTGSSDLLSYPPLSSPEIATPVSLQVSPNETRTSADVEFRGNGPGSPGSPSSNSPGSPSSSSQGNNPASSSIMIGVEVKTLTDVLDSLGDGRLIGTQLYALSANYHQRYLLLVGRYRPHPTETDKQGNPHLLLSYHIRDKQTRALLYHKDGTPMVGWSTYPHKSTRPLPYTYLESALLSPSLTHMHAPIVSSQPPGSARHGVTVRVVESHESAAWWIYALYRTWSKPWTEHRLTKVFDESADICPPRGMERDGIYLLASMLKKLPGVGYESAFAIASHFRKMKSAVLAPEEEWTSIRVNNRALSRKVISSCRELLGC
jgi:hypothetical protein